MKGTGVKVFAPATVANVACGYDLLGFALDKPGDEIIGVLSNQPVAWALVQRVRLQV